MVLLNSHRVSRVPRYLGNARESIHFRLRGYHPLWPPLSRGPRLMNRFVTPWEINGSPRTLPRPLCRNARQLDTTEVWAVPVSLAATQGIAFAFSSWRYLDVSVPSVRFIRAIYSPGDDPALPGSGFPIRRSPDLRLFAPHRGLSQLTTSFIACLCQGIHLAPLLTWLKSFNHYR